MAKEYYKLNKDKIKIRRKVYKKFNKDKIKKCENNIMN